MFGCEQVTGARRFSLPGYQPARRAARVIGKNPEALLAAAIDSLAEDGDVGM